MVPVHCISRSQELKLDFLTKNLKHLFIRNHWTDFNTILQKCSFADPLPRLFKPFGFVKKHGRQGGRGLFSLYIYIENFKNLLAETAGPISIYFCRNVLLVILYQDCSSHLDSSKNMATRGRGLFSLYIYVENFKNLLVRNHWTDFHIICRHVSLVILYQDCSSHIDSSKNMAARGRGLFSLYIYIERKL